MAFGTYHGVYVHVVVGQNVTLVYKPKTNNPRRARRPPPGTDDILEGRADREPPRDLCVVIDFHDTLIRF